MIQSTKPNPGKKIINVDQVTSMYLPDIPATRPTNESNLSVIVFFPWFIIGLDQIAT